MNEQLIYGYPWKLWATPSSLTPMLPKTVADATTRKIQCLAAANQRLTKSLQEIQQMATKGDA